MQVTSAAVEVDGNDSKIYHYSAGFTFISEFKNHMRNYVSKFFMISYTIVKLIESLYLVVFALHLSCGQSTSDMSYWHLCK